MSAKELRTLGTDDKTYNILRSNYYGWFKKIDKGMYALSDKGYAEISDYYDLIETIMSKE